MVGEGKKYIFLKCCSKWSKWHWSNHCSYRGIVPTFKDLPRASESAEIWCKATRIRDFSRWKKSLLESWRLYTLHFSRKKQGFHPVFYFKGSDSDLFLGFLMTLSSLFFFSKSIPMTLQGHRCGLCRQAFSGRAQLLLTERMSQHVAKRKAEWLK